MKLKHPNIVEIHEVYSHGVTHYIVMDFVEGRNLREFYRRRRRFDPIEAADIMVGRDGRPRTTRCSKASRIATSRCRTCWSPATATAKLVDFGLAGVQGAEEAEASKASAAARSTYAGLGTGHRLPAGRPADRHLLRRHDLLPDAHGHAGPARSSATAQQAGKALYQDIKPILELVPKLPLPLAMVVNKALEFDPDKRYQTPADMLVDLKLAIKRVKGAKEGRASGGQELHSSEGLDDQGQPRKLMIVESDVKMQDMLRELFKKNGYRVLVLSDPDRAMDRFFQDPKAADIVLFTTSSNGRAALDAFNRFGQEPTTRDLPTVLLLDQNHGHWEEEAQTSDHRVVAKMPIKDARAPRGAGGGVAEEGFLKRDRSTPGRFHFCNTQQSRSCLAEADECEDLLMSALLMILGCHGHCFEWPCLQRDSHAHAKPWAWHPMARWLNRCAGFNSCREVGHTTLSINGVFRPVDVNLSDHNVLLRLLSLCMTIVAKLH